MSTTITNANGFVVVTQVFPQNESGQIFIPGQQVKHEVPHSAPTTPSKVSKMTQMFLRGEPQSLGIVQIFIGMLFVLVSLTAVISPTQHIQAPLFLGAVFVISGSLSVAARKGKSLEIIRGTMALNIISAIVSLAGIAYLSVLMVMTSSDRICDISHETSELDGSHSRWREKCMWMAWRLTALLYGIWGVLLVLSVLEVCVSISGAVFSWKAIQQREMATVVVVESGHTSGTSTASESDGDAALLDSCDGDGDAAPAPPAYQP